MSVMEDSDEEPYQRWEGYSKWEAVSLRIGRKVSRAVEAYSMLQSAAREQAEIQAADYAEARARILDAAMSLKVEIEREKHHSDVFRRIHKRWSEGDERTDQGYIAEFHELSIQNEGVPGWLFTFVEDIRKAAWELGYLQAGQQVQEGMDPVEEDVNAMFDGIEL